MGRFKGRFIEMSERKSEKSVVEALEEKRVGVADDCFDCVRWNLVEKGGGDAVEEKDGAVEVPDDDEIAVGGRGSDGGDGTRLRRRKNGDNAAIDAA